MEEHSHSHTGSHTKAGDEAKTVFDQLIRLIIKENASDLHLGEGRQPMMRVSGFLVPILQAPVLTHDHCSQY